MRRPPKPGRLSLSTPFSGRIGLLLTAVLVAACGSRSSLLGDGSTATGAAGGSSASTGGSTGVGATAGSGGNTGVGGTAGVGGSTGVGGTAGQGGTGPDVQAILEACVIAEACGAPSVGWPYFTATTCMDGFARLGWWYESPGMLPDPATASLLLQCAQGFNGDCDSYRACYGGDWVELSRCREGGICQGNTMASYPDGPTFDCGAIGGECMNLWSNAQRACCNAEPCGEIGGFTCDGGKASFCGGWGERVDFDCAANGQTCTFDWQVPCKGTGSCDPMTTQSTCEGSVAVYCSGGGLTSHDCGTTGLRTACNPGASAGENPCHAEFKECDPANYTATCSGSTLLTCGNGVILGVQCPGLGFSGCEQTMNGARCQ